MNSNFYVIKKDKTYLCMADGDFVKTPRQQTAIKFHDERSAKMLLSHMQKVHPVHADGFKVIMEKSTIASRILG